MSTQDFDANENRARSYTAYRGDGTRCYDMIGRRIGGHMVIVGMYDHDWNSPHIDGAWDETPPPGIFRVAVGNWSPNINNQLGQVVDVRLEFENETWESLLQNFPEVTSVPGSS